MAIHCALRDEQPRSDLLVAQARRNQPGDVRLAPPQQPNFSILRIGAGGPSPSWRSKGQSDRLVAAQLLAGLDLGLELGLTKRRNGGRFGLRE